MAFRILSVFQTLNDFDEAFEAYRDSTYSTFTVSTSSKTPNKSCFEFNLHHNIFVRAHSFV